MKTINLRDFYYWYTQDEFIDVSDAVAEEMLAGKRYERAQERKMYRHNAQYSLDMDDGIEAAAIIHTNDSPEAVFEMKERFCRLCRALNSLPEIQGRRVEAFYIFGKSRKQIAAEDGVSESAVNESIERGLRAMKKYFSLSEKQPCQTPDFCHGI